MPQDDDTPVFIVASPAPGNIKIMRRMTRIIDIRVNAVANGKPDPMPGFVVLMQRGGLPTNEELDRVEAGDLDPREASQTATRRGSGGPLTGGLGAARYH